MKLKLSFLGAAQNVTGSRFLLETGHKRILVDCGLYQERQFRDRNWDPFPLPPRKLDAVLLTHAHLDHCGLLPKLVREGFRGKIYCTTATAEIAKIVVLDSARLQEEDARYKQKRHRREGRTPPRPVAPLYTTEDAEACCGHFHGVAYEQKVPITDGVEAAFYDAGHILGASIIQVKVTQGDEKRSILFSGDLGREDKPILRDPERFDEADYLLIESTYGDRIHEPVADIEDRLCEVVNAAKEAGGNIVIPSFAIERSQEVLYHLNELMLAKRIPRLMVFLDSPMAARVTEVFRNHPEMLDEEMNLRNRQHRSPFDFAGLQITRTADDSKAINHIAGSVIIIAGSGMCTGGRIKHHLVNNIERRANTILFVGYQAVGTLGRRIVDGEKEVRILGQPRRVRARVERIHGFSAHADREEICAWLSGFKKPPRAIFVVHGELESANALARTLREKNHWKVTVPAYKDKVALD